MQVTTIGLDIAKNVFQVHGIDAAEKVVVRKQLRRSQVLEFFKALPPCLIGMEACATAHYWARELTKLGHQVRLMPAKDVKAYVKRNKNDAADAEAICEAVRRPTMRFVQIKSAEQQGRLMLHRTRDLLMRQRTQVINALRADFAAWIGIVPRQDFDRRQAETRAYLQAGRSLFATHSGGRSPCGIETRAAAAGEVSLAHTASRPQTVQGRGSGTCQQDGAHRLGVAGQRRHLSGTCACACACGSGLIRGWAMGG